jgi:hypothetical protein
LTKIAEKSYQNVSRETFLSGQSGKPYKAKYSGPPSICKIDLLEPCEGAQLHSLGNGREIVGTSAKFSYGSRRGEATDQSRRVLLLAGRAG